MVRLWGKSGHSDDLVKCPLWAQVQKFFDGFQYPKPGPLTVNITSLQ